MAMGDVIRRLAVSLSLETAAFEKGATLAEKRASQMQKKFAKLGDSLSATGQTMTLALTAPLAAFGVSAFNAASDAGELQSAFDQTFGTLAADMNKWAEETGDALGRSTQSMQELANTFGIFFNQAAPTRKEAAEMSKTFAVLAQDLASFYNVTESEALAKLRSGLSGESEPLRDFGVFLTEATVANKALEMGLAATAKELTEQDKILARYNLILESTANAQGDVARTSDGTANQLRAAKAAFEELQVSIGNVLLPVITPLISGLGSLFETLGNLPDGAQTAIVAVAGLAAAAGPLLVASGAMVSAFGTLAPIFAGLAVPLGPVALALGAVAAAGAVIYANWDKIAPLLDELGAKFEAAIGADLREKVSAIGAKLTELWNGPLGQMVRGTISTLFDFQIAYAGVLGEVLIGVLDAVVTAVTGTFTAVLDALTAVSRLLQGDFRGAWEAAGQFVTGIGQTIAGVIDSLFPGLIQLGKDIIRGIVNGIKAAPGAVRDALLGVVQSGVDTVKDFLGIRSPSLLFMQIGDDMMRGLGIGIENGKVIVGGALAEMGREAEVQTVRIAETFEQLANNVMGNLRGLVDGFRKGDFFSIFEGIFGIVTRLGSAGVFGKGFQSILTSVPAFAQGTNYAPGGLSLVGERGPELVNLPRGSQVFSNRELRGMGGGKLDVTVTMDPSTGQLGAFVRDEAGRLIGEAAPAIANAGATQAIGRMRQMESRRLA